MKRYLFVPLLVVSLVAVLFIDQAGNVAHANEINSPPPVGEYCLIGDNGYVLNVLIEEDTGMPDGGLITGTVESFCGIVPIMGYVRNLKFYMYADQAPTDVCCEGFDYAGVWSDGMIVGTWHNSRPDCVGTGSFTLAPCGEPTSDLSPVTVDGPMPGVRE